MTQSQTQAGSSHRWSLWGTYAFLAVDRPELLLEARREADRILDAIAQACSRFRDDSDLVAVNRTPGRWVRVDPLLVAAVRVAVAAAEESAGLVDPCLGRSLVSLGYDRDLAAVHPVAAGRVATTTIPRSGAWREVRWQDDAVRIPEDVSLDLGATAKAWAADLVARSVAERLGCTCVVSLGGDLRVTARDDAPVSWPVVVSEHPADPVATEVTVTGGLATSSTVVRRWRTAGGEQHHLLDPRTGRPVAGPFRTVTAAGTTALAANTASTAALVLGAEAPAWLHQHGVTARLVDHGGRVTTTGDWPAESPTESGSVR